MNIRILRIIFFIPILFLIACQPPAEVNKYIPPISKDSFQNSLVINKPFDDLWDIASLISNDLYQLSAEDKALGEMMFNFRSDDVSKYIDCGMMNDEIYVDYIYRIFESLLDGQINIKFEPVNSSTTRLSVNISYKFISKETGTRWMFETNKPKSILVGNPAYGADPYRECLSKHFLEAGVINQIDAFNL